MLEGVVVPGGGAILTAEDEDDAWVQEFQRFGPLEGFVGVSFFGHLLYLPGTPGFVAEGPVFDLYALLENRSCPWVLDIHCRVFHGHSSGEDWRSTCSRCRCSTPPRPELNAISDVDLRRIGR